MIRAFEARVFGAIQASGKLRAATNKDRFI